MVYCRSGCWGLCRINLIISRPKYAESQQDTNIAKLEIILVFQYLFNEWVNIVISEHHNQREVPWFHLLSSLYWWTWDLTGHCVPVRVHVAQYTFYLVRHPRAAKHHYKLSWVRFYVLWLSFSSETALPHVPLENERIDCITHYRPFKRLLKSNRFQTRGQIINDDADLEKAHQSYH